MCQNCNSGNDVKKPVSLALRCLLLVSWVIPLIGVPVGIYGVVQGIKRKETGLTVIAVISLTITVLGFILNLSTST